MLKPRAKAFLFWKLLVDSSLETYQGKKIVKYGRYFGYENTQLDFADCNYSSNLNACIFNQGQATEMDIKVF